MIPRTMKYMVGRFLFNQDESNKKVDKLLAELRLGKPAANYKLVQKSLNRLIELISFQVIHGGAESFSMYYLEIFPNFSILYDVGLLGSALGNSIDGYAS